MRATPLPVCPRPLPHEALRSWLSRVAAKYGLTAQQMLESLNAGSVAPDGIRLDLLRLAAKTHLPVDALIGLADVRGDWILSDGAAAPVCLACLAADVRAGDSPHLRRLWQQAWYVVCSRHGARLQLAPLYLLFPVHRSRITLAGIQRLARFAGVAWNCGDGRSSTTDGGGASFAVRLTQQAVAGALAGISPPARTWGVLSAGEFLTVAHDLASWALTNFESVAAYPVAYLPPRGTSPADASLFPRKRRPLPPMKPDQQPRRLADMASPAARFGALWWIYALAADAHPTTGLRLEAAARRASFLEDCQAAARAWLERRLSRWAPDYLAVRWSDFRPESASPVPQSLPPRLTTRKEVS